MREKESSEFLILNVSCFIPVVMSQKTISRSDVTLRLDEVMSSGAYSCVDEVQLTEQDADT